MKTIQTPPSTRSGKLSPSFERRRRSTIHALAMLAALLGLAAAQTLHADTVTWDASGANPTAPTDGAGNWSTADIRWSDGSTDNAWVNGNSAIFGSGGAGGTITVGSGVVVANITIRTNYTISANTLTLSNTPTINVPGSATSTTIGSLLAGTSFTKEGAGTLILNPSANNTFTGLTTINAGTVQVGGNDNRVYIGGDLQVNPGGTYAFSVGASPVLGNADAGLNTSSTVIINGGIITNTVTTKYFVVSKVVLENGGVITGTGSDPYVVTNTDARSGSILLPIHRIANTDFRKSTAGTVIIGSRPSASATDGYVVTMNAGTLIFDYAYTANNAVRIQTGAPLTLGGGFLMFSNSVTTIGPSSLNPGSTSIRPGASGFLLFNASATGGNMTFNTITRSVGGTFDFFKSGTGSQTTANANVNGIQGGWATWNKTDWLVGTTFAAYAAYTTSTDPTTWVTANNVSLAGNPSANVPDATSINSLRLNGSSAIALDGTLTLSSGGLLIPPGTGVNSITGGTLKGGSGADLIIHQYSVLDLTIDSTLADNGTATSLTKSGPGKLVLTGANNMTGTNFLNGGAVEVGDLARLAGGSLVMNGGTLRYTGSSATDNRAIAFNGLGGTFDVATGTTLTVTNTVKGSGATFGDLGGLAKIGAGTLILTASNYFNGVTVVSNGVLAVNGTDACDKTTFGAGSVAVYGGTLGGIGLVGGPVAVKNGGTISPGASIGTLTLGTNLTLESGSTSLFEVTNGAAGDLLAVQGNLILQPNSAIAISVLGSALEPTTNTLITYAGTRSGSFNPTVVIAGGSLNASVSIDESTPGQIKLVALPDVAITSQPADLVVSTNTPATFNVSATGSAPIGYQWYSYGSDSNSVPSPVLDETNATYTINSAQPADTGFYSVVVSNASNFVASRIAHLTVGDVVPVIVGPTNKTVIAGNSVTFNTSVIIANPPAALQWQTNAVDVAGATGPALTLNNVPFALDGTIVSVIATNIAGAVTNSALLTVIVTPVIAPQPTDLTVNVGDTAVFSSGATGVPTPALQWYKNGVALSGETGNTLTIVNAQGSNVGTYTLVATNAAGIATSSAVKLTVNSLTLAATALSPANLATGVGYDTPLYVTFNDAVSVRNSGRIRIFNATNSVTPVDTIDMSSNSVVIATLNAGLGIFLTNNIQAHGPFQGDGTAFNYFPVITTGNTAAIYPHPGVLTSNQTYYVTLENGIVADSSGAYFAGIPDTNAWRFATRPTGPANPTNLVVAADGSGDFVTVQGAVDSVPAGSTTPRLINIRDGNYVEIVNISGKHNLTLRGQSRAGTVVGYGNNNNLNPSTANRMAFKVNANDVAIENLTVANTTPQGGTQSEAIMLNTGARRFILNNADVNSLQDTILANVNSSQGYFYNSTVRGNFDYVWGGGNLFITNCLIYTVPNIYVTNNYNLNAARTDFSSTSNATTHWLNPAGSFTANGFSYVNCRLQADPVVNTITLEGANGTPNGLVSFINCLIDTNHYVTPAAGILSTYVLWEYGNSNSDGSFPVSMGLTTLPGGDPRLLAAGDATNWLYGWVPALAPNILSNPVGLTVDAGQPATFTVSATGIPEPTCQWRRNGTNIDSSINPTATSATLVIAVAHVADAANYSVVVTTPAGSATSAAATLTVNPHPNTAAPVFTAPAADSVYTLNIGVNLSVTNTATDADTPAEAVTFSLLSGSGSVTAGGIFTWRPQVGDAGTTNVVTVKVADDGAPSLSATNTFNVVVNPLTLPTVGEPAYAGGQFSLAVSGQVGPDYALQVATNLANGIWTTLLITNSPPSPFTFIDPDAGTVPLQFYRIKVGPPLP